MMMSKKILKILSMAVPVIWATASAISEQIAGRRSEEELNDLKERISKLEEKS